MKSSLLFFGVGGAGLAAPGTGVGVYYGMNGSLEGNQVEQRESEGQDPVNGQGLKNQEQENDRREEEARQSTPP